MKKHSSRLVALMVLCVCTISAVHAASGSSAGARKLAAGSRPNILVIVADDLGQTDLGIYGSEIRTPNLDKLASRGMLLTNYYASPLCAPTRSMLLSGTDNHRAGEGLMDQAVEGVDGYEGHLNNRVVTIASRLKKVGYHTYMAGKWHLGYRDDESAASRGFDRSFTLLAGGAPHFGLMGIRGAAAPYRDDGKLVDSLPADFYTTTYYTDKMLGYIKQSAGDGKPFFAYLAYTAPHWPMQAPAADIQRQRGRYDAGFEVLRQNRFAAWKARGFAPKDAQLPDLTPGYTPWSDMTAEQQAKSSRAMEVYAAMVERMDTEIGRVLAYLKESGQLDNTLILFQSDNGAEGGFDRGPTANDDVALNDIGGPNSYVYVGRGWAEAQGAPYFLQKFFTGEGGIHVPAFVYGPALGVPSGKRNDAVLITPDLAPTLLEFAGGDAGVPVDQPNALPITGKSFAALLTGAKFARRGDADMVGWEHGGHAAIRKGDFKLLWVGTPIAASAGPGPTRPASAGTAAAAAPAAPVAGARPRGDLIRANVAAGGPAGDPVGKGGPWKLFNLRLDPAELHDLSAQYPELKTQMLAEWNRYSKENGVIVKSGVPATGAR
ncbi:MAG: arylsulfatase [Pseudomonadota bacterium]